MRENDREGKSTVTPPKEKKKKQRKVEVFEGQKKKLSRLRSLIKNRRCRGGELSLSLAHSPFLFFSPPISCAQA